MTYINFYYHILKIKILLNKIYLFDFKLYLEFWAWTSARIKTNYYYEECHMIWFHGRFIRAVSMYCSEISAANVLEWDPRTFMCPAIGCSPHLWNYAQLYFDTKHLEKGLMRFWNFWSLFFKKSPFWPVANATIIRPWEDEHDWISTMESSHITFTYQTLNTLFLHLVAV